MEARRMKNILFPSRRMLGALGLAGLMALGLGAGAQAQTWPERPVTIIVPFPAGGNTDTMARLLAERLQRKLGQGFVIDNRPINGSEPSRFANWAHSFMEYLRGNILDGFGNASD
jgi:hypothetical protein